MFPVAEKRVLRYTHTKAGVCVLCCCTPSLGGMGEVSLFTHTCPREGEASKSPSQNSTPLTSNHARQSASDTNIRPSSTCSYCEGATPFYLRCEATDRGRGMPSSSTILLPRSPFTHDRGGDRAVPLPFGSTLPRSPLHTPIWGKTGALDWKWGGSWLCKKPFLPASGHFKLSQGSSDWSSDWSSSSW